MWVVLKNELRYTLNKTVFYQSNSWLRTDHVLTEDCYELSFRLVHNLAKTRKAQISENTTRILTIESRYLFQKLDQQYC